MNIPFDTRYTPDLIFATDRKLSDRFPNDVGQGRVNLMFPERAFIKFANLAHTAMIVDNYLIQFGESGNMYLLDIVNNTFDTVPIANANNLPLDLVQWVKMAGSTAVAMMDAVENNEQAQIWLKLYWRALCYNTTSTVSKKEYDFAMRQIRMGFNLPADSSLMYIRNRKWYYDSKETSWGHMACCIFKSYFESFSDYNRI